MKILLFSLILLTLPLSVSANRVSGLYQATVAVDDQTAGHRQTAVRTAMRTVLIKITGDRFAPQRTSLAPVIEQSDSYVQQYRYIKSSDENITGNGEKGPGLKLDVKFDETTLNDALRRIGVPIWGKERPSTLVWVAVQDESGRHLISLEGDPDYIQTLDERARKRGIELIFPLMDLHDTANLRVSDVWGGFRAPVMEASTRYNADTVLVGRVTSYSSGIWEAQWTSYMDHETTSWSSEGVLPEVVLDEGIDGLADLLASRYVGSTGSMETVQLSILVNEVTTAEQYARLLKYLRSLSSVTDVYVERVEPGSIRFALTAHGGVTAVRQTIELGRLMEPVTGTDNSYRLTR